MTKDEIVTSLRACVVRNFDDCAKCAYKGVPGNQFTCMDNLKISAADLIENQQREIEALRQANRKIRETHYHEGAVQAMIAKMEKN